MEANLETIKRPERTSPGQRGRPFTAICTVATDPHAYFLIPLHEICARLNFLQNFKIIFKPEVPNDRLEELLQNIDTYYCLFCCLPVSSSVGCTTAWHFRQFEERILSSSR
jgi:hypothetical protein